MYRYDVYTTTLKIACGLKSFGARFWLVPQTHNVPHYLLPRPRPDQKIVDFMALTPDWPDHILPGPKQFIINPRLTRFRLQQTLKTPCSEVIAS